MKTKKKKAKSVSQLKREADAVFSKYIRTKYSDAHTGLVECVTCGSQRPIAEMQNGHYISRGNNHLRYDERNCHPQDYACNVARKGNYPAYAAFMVRTYGADIIEQLQWESKEIKQWKPQELTELIDLYKAKLGGVDSATVSM